MEREEQKHGLESPLIVVPKVIEPPRNGIHKFKREEIVGEVKKQVSLAGPIVSVNLLLYCLQVISVMFVGHLGELALSGASMATSFASVTGFSLLIGLGSTLDTFCGQSYGAKQYHMLGIHMQRAMLVLLLASIPLACIWANAGQILVFLGQDHEISAEAGSYARFMIPTIFAYALLQCQVRFLQAQNNVVPMVLSTGFTTLLHVLVCWVLVFKSGLGNKGAALANAISYWINALLLVIYIQISPSCKKTWTGFSREALQDVTKFLRLAIPSATMICIRVSNELGGGRPQAARLAVCVAICLVATEGILAAIVMICGHKFWGYCYSKEEEVVKYVGDMLILLAGSHFVDGIQSVLSGNARGCGWQKIGAFVNLGAYYLIGIPVGVSLAFVYHIGGKVINLHTLLLSTIIFGPV
ncbi:MATE efflux family protein [Actinidia rufa]|uniref:MATE efflux family protein n=1 Tax=Actinidia rufa TaxID=165716 RepID=A0A7J0E351_9ERIC|nr:MATE efflux family protein [Actinidia rufa]